MPPSHKERQLAQDEKDRRALITGLTDQLVAHQMALRVVWELLDGGPGNAGQIAERMTENNDDGLTFSEEQVEAAIGVLDQFSLLLLPGPDDERGSIVLWS